MPYSKRANQPHREGTSYCPISLLLPTSKVLERLLLPVLNEHLHTMPTQHGFRPQRSTTTAHLPIAHSIVLGFNQEKPPHCRKVSLAIDFSNAFDTVPHDLLLGHLMETTLLSNMLLWLSCYLHGRLAACQYQRVRSGFLSVGSGVPQSSVISPCLFNFFVADYPHTADLHSSYADYFTAAVSDHNVNAASQRMSNHATDALHWAVDHGLQVSVNKSNCTLFTSDTHQSWLDPSVSTDGNIFPLCWSPKILGVTLVTHFTFSPHIRGVADRAPSRLSILKALVGVSNGHSKEVLLLTYQMLIKPFLTYAAPVWFPNAPTSATPPCSLYRTQPCALLPSLSRWLPLTIFIRRPPYFLSMLCSQFLLSALRLNQTVTADSGIVISGTPCSLASNRQYPLTSSMASRLPTPIGSLTSTLRRSCCSHCCPLAEQGPGGQTVYGLCL